MAVKLLRDVASPIFPVRLYSTAAYLTYTLLDWSSAIAADMLPCSQQVKDKAM
jgi:hypothetical protein